MKSSHDDVLDLFDHVWQRFGRRMDGLTDEEWRWQPSPDERLSLRWRLGHIASFLREDRNAPWLGLPPPGDDPSPEPTSAASALAAADVAFALWRGQLAALTEQAFAAPVGSLAGPYGDATRRSFALHIADELIHHASEAALLRDLFAARD